MGDVVSSCVPSVPKGVPVGEQWMFPEICRDHADRRGNWGPGPKGVPVGERWMFPVICRDHEDWFVSRTRVGHCDILTAGRSSGRWRSPAWRALGIRIADPRRWFGRLRQGGRERVLPPGLGHHVGQLIDQGQHGTGVGVV